MKFKKFTGALALLVAACLAFAFKPLENKIFACVWFVYNGTGQSSGPPPTYASLAQAHNKNNWTYSSTSPTCTGVDFLCAICVDPSEVYPGADPDSPTDDKPKVDVGPTNPTDAYNALEAAKNATTGKWSDGVVSGTATVEARNTP